MCKVFISRCFIGLFVLALQVDSGAQELVHIKQRDFVDLVREDLYHAAIKLGPENEEYLTTMISQDQVVLDLLTAYLATRYPEWGYRVRSQDPVYLKADEIAAKIADVLADEQAMGLFNSTEELMEYADQYELGIQERASLVFFIGYDQFVHKQFSQAEKTFEKVIRQETPQMNYALYYAGMSALLTGQFEKARMRLSAVRYPDRLMSNIPYYLCGALYAQKKYAEIVRLYGGRLGDKNLTNRQGMRRLIGVAHFQLGNWPEAIESMKGLDRPALEEELLLATAYSKIGRFDKASAIYENLNARKNNWSSKVAFIYATDAAGWGNTGLAIELFNQVIRDGDEYLEESLWNLTVLQAGAGNYRASAELASRLLHTRYSDRAANHIETILQKVEEDEATFLAAIEALKNSSDDLSIAIDAVYNKALKALSFSDFKKAGEYFDMLDELGPDTQTAQQIGAWKGIMAYHHGQYARAQTYLGRFVNESEDVKGLGDLPFQANYFLAYSCFKLKQHQRALGHFSTAREILIQNKEREADGDPSTLHEDILVRMGDVYLVLGDYDKADVCYQTAEELDRYQIDHILYHRGLIAGLMNRPYDKIVLLEQLHKEYPGSEWVTKARYSKAETLFSLGKYDRAFKTYSALTGPEMNEEVREASILQLALISTNKGDYATAEKYYSDILENSKNHTRVMTARRALQEIFADYTFDTEAYLNIAAPGEGDSEMASKDSILYFLALKNIESANWEIAFEQFEKLQKDYPGTRYLLSSLEKQAQILLDTERWIPAAGKLNELLRAASPDSPNFGKSQAAYEDLVYVRMKDYERFLKYAKEFEDKLSGLGRVRMLKASFSTGKQDSVLVHKSMMWLKDDQLSVSQKEEIVFHLVRAEMKKRHWIGALKLYDKIEKALWQTSPRLIYWNALSYTNSDRYTEAISAITTRFEPLKKDAAWLTKSIILLSDNYVIQGETNEALAALEAMTRMGEKIPDSLEAMVQNRLENLRAHIKFTESQKQHGDE